MPATPDWNALTDFARSLADAAAAAILPFFRSDNQVDIKPGAVWDPVTEADRAGERIMRHMIEQRFPDDGINGEEFGMKQGRSGLTWILDPVDGTRAFICGMPTWTTLIGLSLDGSPKVGLMNQPYVGECFYGNPSGAWCDYGGTTRRLRVKPARPLAEAIFCTTAPELYRSDEEKRVLASMSSTTRLTRYGGDAYFFCLVAAGQIDIAMDAQMQAYDIAPLIPIVEGAGGQVSTWEGGSAANGGNVAATSSAGLMEQVLDVIRTTRTPN
jgi:myo-inositol-1(or 4)-monophosphatase